MACPCINEINAWVATVEGRCDTIDAALVTIAAAVAAMPVGQTRTLRKEIEYPGSIFEEDERQV